MHSQEGLNISTEWGPRAKTPHQVLIEGNPFLQMGVSRITEQQPWQGTPVELLFVGQWPDVQLMPEPAWPCAFYELQSFQAITWEFHLESLQILQSLSDWKVEVMPLRKRSHTRPIDPLPSNLQDLVCVYQPSKRRGNRVEPCSDGTILVVESAKACLARWHAKPRQAKLLKRCEFEDQLRSIGLGIGIGDPWPAVLVGIVDDVGE